MLRPCSSTGKRQTEVGKGLLDLRGKVIGDDLGLLVPTDLARDEHDPTGTGGNDLGGELPRVVDPLGLNVLQRPSSA